MGLGWGCNHVSGSCTHGGCYATATLVCELSVFYAIKHGTLLLCSCVHMVRCCCVHLHMAEYDSSKFVERRRHVLAHEDVSVGISSTHPSAHQSQSAMLPNRMHHLEDKLTEPNPTNCLPHVAARTPANVKARTWKNNIQDNYNKMSLLATSCIKSNELTNLKMPMHTWYTYLRKCLTNKTTKQNHESHELLDLTLFHLMVNITFASCNSSRIERDNCCQRERSGGKDLPPIRNGMHQVKLHQTACMANRVRWIRCKLQVNVDFSARFGEKNWRLHIVKTFNDQLHLKTWYAVYFWKNTFYMEKAQ